MGAVCQVQYKGLPLTCKGSGDFRSEDQQDFAIMLQVQSVTMFKYPGFKGSSINESSEIHPDCELPIH